jgi:hypothetical protein
MLARLHSARDAEETAERKGKREARDAKRGGVAARRRPTELDDADAFNTVRFCFRASVLCAAAGTSSKRGRP